MASSGSMSTLTLTLIGVWIVVLIATFLWWGRRLSTISSQIPSQSERVRRLLIEGIPLSIIYLLGLSLILISVGVEWQNLLCFWLMMIVFGGVAVLVNLSGYRRLRSKEQKKS